MCNSENFKCLLLFSAVFINFANSSYKTCQSEKSKTSNVTWIYQKRTNYITYSHPPCLDVNNKLILRECKNGTWIPKNPAKCHTIISDNKNCPNYFIETDVCTIVTRPLHWYERCTELSNKVNSKQLQPKPNENLIWLYAKRRVKYGPYEYMTIDSKHGQILSLNYAIHNTDDLFNKDCLLLHPILNNLVPEYCHKLHPHICIFKKNTTNVICPKGCTSAGIGSGKCYCKKYNTDCNNYATIETPYDKHLLSHFVDQEVCKINNSQIISRNVWQTLNENTNCSICVTDIKYIVNSSSVTPKLVLNFAEKRNKIFLVLYSPEAIFKILNTEAIYCYTDASEDFLKKTLKIEKINKSKNRETLGVQEESVNLYKVEMELYMGRYWCEAHKQTDFNDIVSSNYVIAYKNKKGNEFALRLYIDKVCQQFDCGDFVNIQFTKFIPPQLYEIFKKSDPVIRVMEVYDFNLNMETVDLLLHVTTNKENKIIEEFYKYKNRLLSVNLNISYFRTVEYCIPTKNHLDGVYLSWPLTKIHESTLPNEICNYQDPPNRICEGHFLTGAVWSNIFGQWKLKEEPSEITKMLYNMTTSNNSNKNLKNITKEIKNNSLNSMDVYYALKVLENVDKNDNLIDDVTNSAVEIVDEISEAKTEVVLQTQQIFNSSDKLIDKIENILVKTKYNLSSAYIFTRKNILIFMTNPFLSNYSGLSIYTNYSQVIRNRGETFSNILNKEDLLLSVYVPETILENIYNNTNGDVINVRLLIIVYKNDKFFSGKDKKPKSPIISVNIPNFGSYLINSLPILFRDKSNHEYRECGFWDYGKRGEHHKGRWSTIGGNFLGKLVDNEDIYICTFSHLTHFALLILEDYTDLTQGLNYFYLRLITIIGLLLTIIGLLGVLLTAMFFQNWRARPGTKILINLSTAITFQALSVQLMDKESVHSYMGCLTTGMLLHYMVISKFLWMLIYAYLQYLRFVKVLGPMPNRLVLKSVLFGWGLGLIPVISVTIFDSNIYKNNEEFICYPRGLSLYLGILLPITVIVLINLVIFGVVMFEVWNRKIESQGKSVDSNKLQIKLSILLFIIFGIPWVFGIIAEIVQFYWIKMFFIYLFCVTATIEQFILFIFYVALNKETQKKWIVIIKKNKLNNL
ncbi:unnamed protein product [Brassicogethes aeneus]|uniref:Uncharacterized protein n=1 Tax=Brassicogethes aeneus TaxID=1431903 RepID=A0A9P0FES8_BRAAE|nr:unnamed protein product [Brassicogethes aeneus]